MGSSLFSRLLFPSFVKVSTSELGRLSRVLSSGVLEVLMRSWAGADGGAGNASGVVEGLKCTAGTGLFAAVSAGLAFRYDSSGVDLAAIDAHPWRLVSLRQATTVELSAGDATHPRIDLIVVADGEADGALVSVPIFDPTTRLFGPENHPRERLNAPTFSVVQGTPAASPVAPATPAGSLLLSRVSVPAGAASAAACSFVDARTLLRGPGKLWSDLVAKAGDTMTGALTLPLAIFSGSGDRTILQVSSTGHGLRVDDTDPAAPEYSFRGTSAGPLSGISGTKVYAGEFVAADAKIRLGVAPDGTEIGYSEPSGVPQVSLGTVRAAAGRFAASTASPAVPTSVDLGTLWSDLAPFASGRIVGGAPPAIASGWNVAAVSRVALGQYQIDLVVPFPDAAKVVLLGNGIKAGAYFVVVQVSTISASSFQVALYEAGTNTLIDCDFSFVAFALAHA